MKQALKFQSEQEFQSFFGQLSSAELPGFQAIEGAGGDQGFDGLERTTAYQVYFPEEKNRTDKKFIEKIDEDLAKIIENKQKLGLEITEWVFVIPEDLRIEVVAHLQKKTKETGVNCIYWGATKLTELITKHPHIQDSFPTIFLPPVREGINNIQETLAYAQRPKVLTSVDIITDNEFTKMKQVIIEEYHQKTKSFTIAHGTSSSAYLVADRTFKEEADRKVKELQMKKDRSDKAFELELDEITEYYKGEVEKVNDEMAKRGLFSSGIRDKELAKVESQRKRDFERLLLKFGKATSIVEGQA